MFDSARHLTPDFARTHLLPESLVCFIHFNNLWGLPLSCFRRGTDDYIENGENHQALALLYTIINAERDYVLNEDGVTIQLKQLLYLEPGKHAVLHRFAYTEDGVYRYVVFYNHQKNQLFADWFDVKTGCLYDQIPEPVSMRSIIKKIRRHFAFHSYDKLAHDNKTPIITEQTYPAGWYKEKLLSKRNTDDGINETYFYSVKNKDEVMSTAIDSAYQALTIGPRDQFHKFTHGVVIQHQLPQEAFYQNLYPAHDYLYLPTTVYSVEGSVHRKETYVYDKAWNVIDVCVYEPEKELIAFELMKEELEDVENMEFADDKAEDARYPTQFYRSEKSSNSQLKELTLPDGRRVKFPCIE